METLTKKMESARDKKQNKRAHKCKMFQCVVNQNSLNVCEQKVKMDKFTL